MAITTLAQLKAGIRPPITFLKAIPSNTSGNWGTLWATAGTPGVGSYDNTLNGVALNFPVAGAIQFTDPPGGSNAYVAKLECTPSRFDVAVNAQLLLCDRLWHNGNIDVTSTSLQTITSPSWPARDEDGSVNGKGVFLAVEVSATVGAATPNITVSYTNSDGVSGRTASNIQATVSAATAGLTFLLSLQAGDVGVKSVEGITLSASWISGTINLVAYRSLIYMTETVSQIAMIVDAITGGFPRVYDDSVLYFMQINKTTSASGGQNGSIQFAFG